MCKCFVHSDSLNFQARFYLFFFPLFCHILVFHYLLEPCNDLAITYPSFYLFGLVAMVMGTFLDHVGTLDDLHELYQGHIRVCLTALLHACKLCACLFILFIYFFYDPC